MNQLSLTTVRQWLVLLGGSFILLSFLIIGVSFTGIALPGIVQWPGDDTLLVVAFVTVIISLGAFVININFVIKNRGSSLPEPETTPPIVQAGSEFDQIVEPRLLVLGPSPDERRDIRKRLRQTAVQTIRQTGVSRRRAVEIVNSGEWTEQTTAAAFLGQQRLPRALRLCSRLSRRLVFQHAVRRTARAIITYADESKEQ